VAIVAGALAPATVAASAPDRLFERIAKVERRAAKAIGRDYACTVVTAPPGHDARAVRIFVTDRSAIGAARRASERLDFPSGTEIRVTSKRLRRATMRRIRDRAIETQPPDVEEIRIGEQADSPYYARCPKLRLMILPEGEASQAAEDWARRLEERYGGDRIAVVRGRTTLRPGR
jgi:hypothetical protein